METVAVGILAALERARWGLWDAEVDMAPRTYARAVQAAGALALILPPDDVAAEEPARLLDRVDALLLAGGADIDPGSYGAREHAETAETWPQRDRFEIALAHAALERGMPVLGVCRGMQMLNVACGGTVDQHLPDALGHDDHRRTPGVFGDHEVELEPGSLAARAAGGERVAVRSHHHQGVGELGEGLAVTGRAAADGVIEAIEMPDRDYALGVLWHPEEDPESPVIASLVAAAKAGPTQPPPSLRVVRNR